MADIRFMALEGGPRIAYACFGSGPPLVFAPAAVTHLGATLDNPAARNGLEALSRSYTVIIYDRWGNGLSDRQRDDWSLDSEAFVLRQLTSQLGLPPFALIGISGGGPASVHFATRYPGTVSKLVLYGTYASPAAEPADLEIILAFIRGNWGMAAGAVAQLFVPDLDPEHLQWFLQLEREGADGEAAERTNRLEVFADVTAELADVAVPTLVVHRRDDRVCPFEKGRQLASLLPSARFVPLDGEQHFWFRGDVPALLAAITNFVGTSFVAAGGPRTKIRGTRPGPVLSRREEEVLALVARGWSNQQIANELVLSRFTVARHLSAILAKTESANRTEAAHWWTNRRSAPIAED